MALPEPSSSLQMNRLPASPATAPSPALVVSGSESCTHYNLLQGDSQAFGAFHVHSNQTLVLPPESSILLLCIISSGRSLWGKEGHWLNQGSFCMQLSPLPPSFGLQGKKPASQKAAEGCFRGRALVQVFPFPAVLTGNPRLANCFTKGFIHISSGLFPLFMVP